MSTRPGPPAREHPFFRNLAERRQRRAQQAAPIAAANDQPQTPRKPRTFRRTAAHYWHHQRKAARAAGNRYPSFVQVPGPWRVAKLGAMARARQRGRPRDRALLRAWFEWLFTRPKVLLTRSGSARLVLESFSVAVVLGTLWSFWYDQDKRREDRVQMRLDRINNAWALIAAAKDKSTGNIGLVGALETLRSEFFYDLTGISLPGATLRYARLPEMRFVDGNLSAADLRFADLSGAQLDNVNLANAHFGLATLRGATLWGANLRNAYLHGADLSDADLTLANLSNAFIGFADCSGASLRFVDLSDTWLGFTLLSGADLTDADLSFARLRLVAKIEFPDGTRVSSLEFAELGGADLAGADLTGTPFGIDAPGPDVMPAPDSRYKWSPD